MTALRKPPTAFLRDVTCPSGVRASAASVGTVTEAALFDAYTFPAPVRVSRECACGGDITASRGDWAWIAASVRAHQETVQHAEWRLSEGIA